MSIVISRELRGENVYWIHVYGPASDMSRFSYLAASEARKWSAELGMRAGRWVSSGGSYHGAQARVSMCYSFTEVTR